MLAPVAQDHASKGTARGQIFKDFFRKILPRDLNHNFIEETREYGKLDAVHFAD